MRAMRQTIMILVIKNIYGGATFMSLYLFVTAILPMVYGMHFQKCTKNRLIHFTKLIFKSTNLFVHMINVFKLFVFTVQFDRILSYAFTPKQCTQTISNIGQCATIGIPKNIPFPIIMCSPRSQSNLCDTITYQNSKILVDVSSPSNPYRIVELAFPPTNAMRILTLVHPPSPIIQNMFLWNLDTFSCICTSLTAASHTTHTECHSSQGAHPYRSSSHIYESIKIFLSINELPKHDAFIRRYIHTFATLLGLLLNAQIPALHVAHVQWYCVLSPTIKFDFMILRHSAQQSKPSRNACERVYDQSA